MYITEPYPCGHPEELARSKMFISMSYPPGPTVAVQAVTTTREGEQDRVGEEYKAER
jgi:hypothetical protein